MIHIVISDTYDDMLSGYDAIVREVAVDPGVRLYPHIEWCHSPREVAAQVRKLLSSSNDHDAVISTLTLTVTDYISLLISDEQTDHNNYRIVFCSGDTRTECTFDEYGNLERFPLIRFSIEKEIDYES